MIITFSVKRFLDFTIIDDIFLLFLFEVDGFTEFWPLKALFYFINSAVAEWSAKCGEEPGVHELEFEPRQADEIFRPSLWCKTTHMSILQL